MHQNDSGRPEPRRGMLSPSVSWHLVFRVFLGALFASTAVGLWYATLHRADFQTSFPGSESAVVYLALLITGGAGLVAICGLWMWRRWAVVMYVGVAVAGLVLDVPANAPLAHGAAVLGGLAALIGLVYLNRERFRTEGKADEPPGQASPSGSSD